MRVLVQSTRESILLQKLQEATHELGQTIECLLFKDGKVKTSTQVNSELNSSADTKLRRELVAKWLTLRFLSGALDDEGLNDRLEAFGPVLEHSLRGIPGIWSASEDLLRARGPAVDHRTAYGVEKSIDDCALEAVALTHIPLWNKPYFMMDIRKLLRLNETEMCGLITVEEKQTEAAKPPGDATTEASKTDEHSSL